MTEPTKKDEKDVPILNHEYDGIRELDNQLPRWWLYLFYITILFAAAYYFYYEFGGGTSIRESYEKDVAVLQKASAIASSGGAAFPVLETFTPYLGNPQKIASGKAAYTARCAPCHGDQGQGVIGPNLTDDFWLNGDGTPAAIAKIIHDGVAAKGMPAWGSMMNEEELYSVSAYVQSLRGSNPPGAKAPQGQPAAP